MFQRTLYIQIQKYRHLTRRDFVLLIIQVEQKQQQQKRQQAMVGGRWVGHCFWELDGCVLLLYVFVWLLSWA